MNACLKLPAALGALIALMSISSCATLEGRLNSAAIEQGRAQASFPPTPLPDDCREQEPHATVAVGMEIRSVLKRERAALDRANARVMRCAQFTEELITGWTAKGN